MKWETKMIWYDGEDDDEDSMDVGGGDSGSSEPSSPSDDGGESYSEPSEPSAPAESVSVSEEPSAPAESGPTFEEIPSDPAPAPEPAPVPEPVPAVDTTSYSGGQSEEERAAAIAAQMNFQTEVLTPSDAPVEVRHDADITPGAGDGNIFDQNENKDVSPATDLEAEDILITPTTPAAEIPTEAPTSPPEDVLTIPPETTTPPAPTTPAPTTPAPTTPAPTTPAPTTPAPTTTPPVVTTEPTQTTAPLTVTTEPVVTTAPPEVENIEIQQEVTQTSVQKDALPKAAGKVVQTSAVQEIDTPIAAKSEEHDFFQGIMDMLYDKFGFPVALIAEKFGWTHKLHELGYDIPGYEGTEKFFVNDKSQFCGALDENGEYKAYPGHEGDKIATTFDYTFNKEDYIYGVAENQFAEAAYQEAVAEKGIDMGKALGNMGVSEEATNKFLEENLEEGMSVKDGVITQTDEHSNEEYQEHVEEIADTIKSQYEAAGVDKTVYVSDYKNQGHGTDVHNLGVANPNDLTAAFTGASLAARQVDMGQDDKLNGETGYNPDSRIDMPANVDSHYHDKTSDYKAQQSLDMLRDLGIAVPGENEYAEETTFDDASYT